MLHILFPPFALVFVATQERRRREDKAVPVVLHALIGIINLFKRYYSELPKVSIDLC